MKSTLLIFVLFFNVNAVLAAACKQNPSQLIAHYRVTEGDSQHQKLTLARFNNQAGQFYHDKNYGDWWSKSSNSHLMLTRYFPAFKKAIEYQPSEIKLEASENTWQKQWQMISDQFIAKMTPQHIESKGCLRVEMLTLKEHDVEYILHWLPMLRLVEQLEVVSKGQVLKSWQLIALNDQPADVQQYVKNLSTYQTIDYADIGDNEADPFLAKMIHQGFKATTSTEHIH
ncbi:hypothetical protein [Thalassotalea sediminis]|uniref:hypothetical protein n=1 Tax=Thalassotalea sediminis TaxID=1759089 RepID=UPI0025747B3F|nr:hypothetical protein [Thalassotalea sediminis]